MQLPTRDRMIMAIRTKKLTLNWTGGLKKYCGQYTSIELQKMALKWGD